MGMYIVSNDTIKCDFIEEAESPLHAASNIRHALISILGKKKVNKSLYIVNEVDISKKNLKSSKSFHFECDDSKEFLKTI